MSSPEEKASEFIRSLQGLANELGPDLVTVVEGHVFENGRDEREVLACMMGFAAYFTATRHGPAAAKVLLRAILGNLDGLELKPGRTEWDLGRVELDG